MDGCYDEMADWWSFGVLLYDMFVSIQMYYKILILIIYYFI